MQQENNEISVYRDYFGFNASTSAKDLKQLAAISAETISNMSFGSANAMAMQQTAIEMATKGVKVLNALCKNNLSFFGNEELDVLRVIVATDGTRPSYPVSNGIPQTALYASSEWRDLTDARATTLQKAIQCTGRINLMERGIGTGFLIGPKLVMTNRHVLQAITMRNDRTVFVNPVYIDFACEGPNSETSKTFKITKVVYTGPNEIKTASPSLQDMALLEVEEANGLPLPIAINTGGFVTANTNIFLIGFPNQVQVPAASSKVFVDFFENMMGYKKVAPGKIIDGREIWPGRFCHDASTLRGNSGSLIVKYNNETSGIGLHFGGTAGPPSENWAHEIDSFCNEEGIIRDIFDTYGVARVTET